MDKEDSRVKSFLEQELEKVLRGVEEVELTPQRKDFRRLKAVFLCEAGEEQEERCVKFRLNGSGCVNRVEGAGMKVCVVGGE